MLRQVIFVIEPKRKTDSDGIYLMEIINYYYPNIRKENTISIKFVMMEGKYNYKKAKVQKHIEKLTNLERKTKVIYVFDKDMGGITYNDTLFANKVIKYCKQNKYELVWFVKDIENVMLKRSSTSKTREARRFKENKDIKNIQKKDLTVINPTVNGTSNVLIVLNKIFKWLKIKKRSKISNVLLLF